VPWLRGTISYQAPARDGFRKVVRQQNFQIGGAIEIPPGAFDPALVVRIASVEFVQQFAALLGLESEIKTRLALEQQLFAPCSVLIGPGFDGEQVAAGLGRREASMPPIVARQPHRRTPPIGLGLLSPQQLRGQLIVALAEQIRPYFNGFADNALDWITAAVDARIDVLDQKPRSGRIARSHLRKLRNHHPSRTGRGRRLHHFCTVKRGKWARSTTTKGPSGSKWEPTRNRIAHRRFLPGGATPA
jgi:hypothetical protein